MHVLENVSEAMSDLQVAIGKATKQLEECLTPEESKTFDIKSW